jgi:DNA-binding beta-propeller fold protein YncE
MRPGLPRGAGTSRDNARHSSAGTAGALQREPMVQSCGLRLITRTSRPLAHYKKIIVNAPAAIHFPRIVGAAAVIGLGTSFAAVCSTARAGGPPIKTQQCSVVALPGNFTLSDQLYVANRSNVITGYLGTLQYSGGFVTAPPNKTLGGGNTQLALVSRNYLVGMARDGDQHLFVAGSNANTVNVYETLVPGAPNVPPIASLTSADGLSQPAGLAYDAGNNLLYVANAGSNSIAVYKVALGTPQPFSRVATLTGLSAPLGLALNSGGTLLNVANRGNNTIALIVIDAPNRRFSLMSPPFALQDLTGPVGIALHPNGNKLYVANNGKTAGWYSVTIYNVNPVTGRVATAAAHIGGNLTGLCNPSAVAVEPTHSYLYVANRESSGGSITFYKLKADGALDAPTDFNVQPAAMLLHDSTNQLGAPVGLFVGGP